MDLRRHQPPHDQGKETFSDELPETLDFWPAGPLDKLGLGYVTFSNPVTLTDDRDLIEVKSMNSRRSEMGLVQQGGSVLRYTDYSPKSSSLMHRTVSCHYAIVDAGTLECLVDSWESRVLNVADVLVQRGTVFSINWCGSVIWR